jgi:hypothetical protein
MLRQHLGRKLRMLLQEARSARRDSETGSAQSMLRTLLDAIYV